VAFSAPYICVQQVFAKIAVLFQELPKSRSKVRKDCEIATWGTVSGSDVCCSGHLDVAASVMYQQRGRLSPLRRHWTVWKVKQA
jgi:hypothetical protein